MANANNNTNNNVNAVNNLNFNRFVIEDGDTRFGVEQVFHFCNWESTSFTGMFKFSVHAFCLLGMNEALSWNVVYINSLYFEFSQVLVDE